MKRPVGITIIAIIAIVGGVLQLLGGLSLLGFGAGVLQAFLPVMGGSQLVGAFGIGIGVTTIVMAVLSIVFGVGALGMRSWAWTLGVVLYALSVIAGIIALVTSGFSTAMLIATAVAAAILAYLLMPEIRADFGHESDSWRMTHGGGTPLTHA